MRTLIEIFGPLVDKAESKLNYKIRLNGEVTETAAAETSARTRFNEAQEATIVKRGERDKENGEYLDALREIRAVVDELIAAEWPS